MREYKYYMEGRFLGSSEKSLVFDPFLEEPFAEISYTQISQLSQAVFCAREAYRLWSKRSFAERAKLLKDIAQIILENLRELAELETKEIGKPLKESLFVDIPLAAEVFSYYASFLERLEERTQQTGSTIDIFEYKPYGVCGIYLPYNVPLMIFGFTAAAALAAGNAVIIKPSEYASLSLLRLTELLDLLSLPKGLIQVVTGRGDELGHAFAEQDIDLISFTGSRETLGKVVAASAKNPKKIICELGGANCTVVFQDADLLEAEQNILGSSFMKQGQICIGTSIALVEENIYDSFVPRLVEKTKKITLGNPFEPAVGLGPLVSQQHRSNVEQKVAQLLKTQGKLLCGGVIPRQKGYFYPATIIELSSMLYEEFFAPVLLVYKFKDYNEALKIVSQNPTGLVCQIWTKDLEKARTFASSAEAGTVWINTFAQMSAKTPFGGFRQSGFGRNLGEEGFFEYVQTKHTGIGFDKSPVSGWFGL